MIDIFEFN